MAGDQALALPDAAGKLNAKLKSDFRCYPNNGHAATASVGPFCATSRLTHRRKSDARATDSANVDPRAIDGAMTNTVTMVLMIASA